MEFHIETMTCSGCVRGVTRAIQSVDPVAQVSADLERQIVAVVTTAPRERLEAVLADAGFAAR